MSDNGEKVDHFAEERARLLAAADTLGDIGVTFGEFAADNMFGDPDLRDALLRATVAEGAIRAAWILARQAVDLIPGGPDA